MVKKILKLLLFVVLTGSTLYGALTKTEVSELYVALLNRASEGEGNNYWQTTQPTMVETANVMLDIPDSKTYFGSSIDTDQDFIEHIYKNTLNKTVEDDPEGIAYWVNMLSSASRGEVVVALIEAVETYKNSEDTLAKMAYDQFTNRVEVSNYMADTLYNVPADYATSTGFGHDLIVTDELSTVEMAKESVNLLADNQSTNSKPIANAGVDQNVTFGERVYFDASGSTDSDGTIVSYTWKYQSYVYTTSQAKKSFSSSRLSLGRYIVTLVVTDNEGATDTDSIVVTVLDDK